MRIKFLHLQDLKTIMDKTKDLLDTVIEGLQEKKGKRIKSLDFTRMENAICKYFVICHGDSNTQVNALADSVEETTRKKLKVKPWQKEGFTNGEWLILDYSDVVVHIFQREIRDYYRLEELWADCKITDHEEF